MIFFGQKYPWPWRSDLVSYGGSHPNFQDLNFPGMVCHWYITMANGKTAHLPSEVFTPKGPGTRNCRRFPIKASRFFLVWRSRFHHWPEGMRHRTGVQNLGILSPRYGEFTRKNDHQPLAFGNLFFKQHQLTFGHLMGPKVVCSSTGACDPELSCPSHLPKQLDSDTSRFQVGETPQIGSISHTISFIYYHYYHHY